MRKFPAEERPEKIHRLLPHCVFQLVKNRSNGNKENARIIAALIEIKTHETKETNEYKGMSNKVPAGKRIGKNYPAEELIDNIGQYGSKGNIPVIDPIPNMWYKITNDEEYPYGNPNMTENEHDKEVRFYEYKNTFLKTT